MSLRLAFVRVGTNPWVQVLVTNRSSPLEMQRDFDRDINSDEENEKRIVIGFIRQTSDVADVLEVLCRDNRFAEGLEHLLGRVYNHDNGY